METTPITAYVLMEYPRMSETFISNEILRLEQMGVALHVFSIKQPKDVKVHGSVQKITAPVSYLPAVTSLSGTSFWKWLRANLPRYFSSHRRLFGFRPWSYLRTLMEAIGLCFHARPTIFGKPKKVFFKEFLQAGYIAMAIVDNPRITHLHAHFCHGATTIAMFVSQILGVGYSFTAHAKDIYLLTLNPGDLLQQKIRRAKFVVTCTEANRRHLQNNYPADTPIHSVYHGLDPHLFTPRSTSNGDLPIILSVGRFVEKKGFGTLVEACRILRDRGHVFQCRIIGGPGDEVSGDQTPLIRQLIRDGGLQDHVELSPGVTQEELQDIYGQATVFALPCQILANGDRDGIPNVIAEAMATGLPVVASSISGIPELITDRTNGLLIPEKNSYALAEALEELMRSPALRMELGKAARATICRIFDSHLTTRALQHLLADSKTITPQIAERSDEPLHVG